MSKYSETIGSFVRTGSYPLEADLVFESYDNLLAWAEENLKILHEGLFKIVAAEGKYTLYWAVKDGEDFTFSELINGTNIEEILLKLEELELAINDEVEDRTEADQLLQEQITTNKENIDIAFNLIKTIAGYDGEDLIAHLKGLPYGSIEKLSAALNKFLNETDSEDNTINTLLEIQAFLEGYTDLDVLKTILTNLEEFFTNWINEIIGTPVPDELFNSLRKIENAIIALSLLTKNRADNILTELDLTQVGVGLSQDGSFSPDKTTNYLQDATSVMNALRTLDSLLHDVITNTNLEAKDTSTVDMDVIKTNDKTILSADIKLSPENGNDLLIKENGLYHHIDAEYADGILTLKVNGNIRKQFDLGLSSIVEDSYYDADTESIVLIFKLLSGDALRVVIPAAGLITEWAPDNSAPEKVVELTRERVINGADKLSADVRIWTDKNNILKKYGNTLGVEGTSENITHNGQTLNVVLEDLDTKIDNEVVRATAKETELEANINQFKNDVSVDVEDINDELASINNALKAETDRAVAEESNIKTQILDLKDADTEIRQTNENLNTRIATLLTNLQSEIERATNVETRIDQRLTNTALLARDTADGLVAEITRALVAETNLDNKINTKEQELTLQIHLVSDEVTAEVTRATTEENNIKQTVNSNYTELINKFTINSEAIDDITEELNKKLESVELTKESDLVYDLLVNGISIGKINIPQDLFLKEVTVIDNTTLRFIFLTSEGETITDINIQTILSQVLSDLKAEIDTKAPINSPIFTGVPMVEVSPDPTDASLRIPSTNWVRDRIAEVPMNNPESYWLKLE